jgi:hypothetical protein
MLESHESGRHLPEFAPWKIPWLPALASLVAAILFARLPDQFIFGTHQTLAAVVRWLVPALILILLCALIVIHWEELRIHHTIRSLLRRRMAITLIAIITAANVLSVFLLVRFIINGGHSSGHQLVVSAIDIWWTNIIVFALWFWELDRGGPAARARGNESEPDFLFPQMTDRELFPAAIQPSFVDYFYISFTNAAAFSPTDTMPLTSRAKLLMLAEAGMSLLTLLMVASRAVNIL